MRLLVLSFGIAILLPSAIDAGATNSTIVECSSIVENGTFFDACATWSQETPTLATISGHKVWVGNYKNEYTIVQGLKEGADTFSLNETLKKEAFRSGITVTVERDAFFECWVTVNMKGKLTMCSNCVYCGEDTISADCTNLKGGRSVTCESTGTGAVFFPFTSAALNVSTKVPTAATVSAPVAAPVLKVSTQKPITPVTVPVQIRAPVSAPKQIRAPTGAPKQVTSPMNLRPPTSAPKQVRAPTSAPKQARVPSSAPKQFTVPEVAPLQAKAPVANAPRVPLTAASAPAAAPTRVRIPIAKRRPLQKPSSARPKAPASV
jgi:hypothetical protein